MIRFTGGVLYIKMMILYGGDLDIPVSMIGIAVKGRSAWLSAKERVHYRIWRTSIEPFKLFKNNYFIL